MNKCIIEEIDISKTEDELVKLIKKTDKKKHKKLKSEEFKFISPPRIEYYDLNPIDLSFKYSNTIFDIIFKNNIHKKLKQIFGVDMYLFKFVFRYIEPNEKGELGYYGWHRDTLYDSNNNNIKGMMPCEYKMIIYPNIDNSEYDCFKIIPDSFVPFKNEGLNIEDYDHTNEINKTKNWTKNLDKILQFNKLTIKNSNTKALLFDSSCAHTVINPKKKQYRLIYQFASEKNINYHIKKKFHKLQSLELFEHYKKLLNEYS